nr:PREDICTED: D-aspartate oxidase [Lepisosteus oculatus]
MSWSRLLCIRDLVKLKQWQIFREIPGEKRPFWSEDVLGFRFMTGAELKRFPQHKAGYAFTTIKCECLTYLPWLQKSPIVHNYGHGGWGVSLSWGTALETMRLVQQCIHERPLISRL